MTLTKKDYLFVSFIIFVGIILRLLWPGDMEWKYDEVYMFEMAKKIASGESWTWLGMRSGVGLRNPGMSIWPFSFMAIFSSTPIGMVQWVMTLNILSLLGFIYIAYKLIPKHEQYVWYFGIALMAVSPMAILFSRKIWAQDILPFFTFLTILGHLHRHKIIGSLIWGMIGALLGQIHMSGFFFAFGIFISTLIYDRSQNKKLTWFAPWVIGSILGTLPMTPWLVYLMDAESSGSLKLKNLYKFRFFYFWPLDAFGIHLRYSLKGDFWEFIKYPYLFNIPSYFMAFLHLFLIGTGLSKLKNILPFLKEKIALLKQNNFFNNWTLFDFYLFASFIGLGIVLGFSGVTLHEHYMIIAYPFIYIWLAKVFKDQLKILKLIIVAQMLISISFLVFIHQNGGSIKGDYGKTYSRIIQEGIRIHVDLGD